MSKAILHPAAAADQALSYAKDYGWHVLPLHSIAQGKCTCGNECSPAGKHPRTPNGVKNATCDAGIIADWWRRWPSANVGIATGKLSNIFVLDVDGDEGEESLRELEAEYGQLPPTVESRTGGGGRHVLFRWPGWPVTNKVRLAPGLDIRGDGGYIVAPPSAHISGRNYEWERSSYPGEVEVAPAPQWLLDKIGAPGGNGRRRIDPQEILAGVPEGQRNDDIFRYACRLRAQGRPPAEIRDLALVAAGRCKPPLPETEALRIVESALCYPGPESKSYHKTDLGLAERFVDAHGDDVRYCQPWHKWLVWDGCQWKLDDTGAVMRYAKDTVRSMYVEAAATEDDKERRELVAHAQKSEQRDRLAAMIALAESEPGIPVLPEGLDVDPWLLNVANGTIDLRTGELYPHDRADMLTKLAPVEYDPKATCPRWEQFVDEIMGGNKALVQFLQRAAGYSLTGDTSEHVLLILYGTGRNGKSTFINALLAAMGDYAIQGAPDLLMTHHGERHPTELADLFGRRFVVTVESGSGRRLDEALVKRLTGGDIIRARRMREDWWEFPPTHKLWLATNHKPHIHGTDIAIWSRIKLVPFTVAFLDGDPRQDKQLPTKLAKELAGILRWCVEGCLAWQEHGLGTPEEVVAATDAYRAEQDMLADFFAECCVVDPAEKCSAKELYARYVSWCEAAREKPASQRRFGEELTERGYERARGAKGVWYWYGLGERVT